MSSKLRRLATWLRGRTPPHWIESSDYRTANRDARVAIVGLGRWGLAFARLLAGMGYQLVAGCDTDPARRAELAASHPKTLCTANLAELAGSGADVFVVATLAASHRSIVEALVAAGARRILCEKPVASTVPDLRALERLVGANRLRLAVNHLWLWSPDYQRIGARARSGELGALRSVELRFKPQGFGNIGCHELALAQRLTGRRIESIDSVEIDRDDPFRRQPDLCDHNADARFTLTGGVSLRAANLPTLVGETSCDLGFEGGRIEILHAQGGHREWRGDAHVWVPFEHPDGGETKGRSRALFVDRAVSSLLGDEPDDSFALGARAVEAVIGAQLRARGEAARTFPLPDDTATPYPFS